MVGVAEVEPTSWVIKKSFLQNSKYEEPPENYTLNNLNQKLNEKLNKP